MGAIDLGSGPLPATARDCAPRDLTPPQTTLPASSPTLWAAAGLRHRVVSIAVDPHDSEYVELTRDLFPTSVCADHGGGPGAGRDADRLALRLSAVPAARPRARLAVPDPGAAGRPGSAGDHLGHRRPRRPATASPVPADRLRPGAGHRARRLLWVVAARLVLRRWWSGPGSRMAGMELPGWLLAVAVAALPERRREWGRAMLAELAEPDRERVLRQQLRALSRGPASWGYRRASVELCSIELETAMCYN
jgi:hypothetical protein